MFSVSMKYWYQMQLLCYPRITKSQRFFLDFTRILILAKFCIRQRRCVKLRVGTEILDKKWEAMWCKHNYVSIDTK